MRCVMENCNETFHCAPWWQGRWSNVMKLVLEHCDKKATEHCDDRHNGALRRKGSWDIVMTIEKCDENCQQAKWLKTNNYLNITQLKGEVICKTVGNCCLLTARVRFVLSHPTRTWMKPPVREWIQGEAQWLHCMVWIGSMVTSNRRPCPPCSPRSGVAEYTPCTYLNLGLGFPQVD